MSRVVTFSAVTVLAFTAVAAGAQTKVIEGEMKTTTVTVEAIDHSARQLTVKKPDGLNETFYVSKDLKRFDSLKVGDKITARYYENLVLRLKEPGTPDVDTTAGGLVPVPGAPAGTMSFQRSITATISAIDPSVPSITFTGPNGWKYSSRVQDKAALAKVKVGDKVNMTWTMAALVSVQ